MIFNTFLSREYTNQIAASLKDFQPIDDDRTFTVFFDYTAVIMQRLFYNQLFDSKTGNLRKDLEVRDREKFKLAFAHIILRQWNETSFAEYLRFNASTNIEGASIEITEFEPQKIWEFLGAFERELIKSTNLYRALLANDADLLLDSDRVEVFVTWQDMIDQNIQLTSNFLPTASNLRKESERIIPPNTVTNQKEFNEWIITAVEGVSGGAEFTDELIERIITDPEYNGKSQSDINTLTKDKILVLEDTLAAGLLDKLDKKDEYYDTASGSSFQSRLLHLGDSFIIDTKRIDVASEVEIGLRFKTAIRPDGTDTVRATLDLIGSSVYVADQDSSIIRKKELDEAIINGQPDLSEYLTFENFYVINELHTDGHFEVILGQLHVRNGKNDLLLTTDKTFVGAFNELFGLITDITELTGDLSTAIVALDNELSEFIFETNGRFTSIQTTLSNIAAEQTVQNDTLADLNAFKTSQLNWNFNTDVDIDNIQNVNSSQNSSIQANTNAIIALNNSLGTKIASTERPTTAVIGTISTGVNNFIDWTLHTINSPYLTAAAGNQLVITTPLDPAITKIRFSLVNFYTSTNATGIPTDTELKLFLEQYSATNVLLNTKNIKTEFTKNATNTFTFNVPSTQVDLEPGVKYFKVYFTNSKNMSSISIQKGSYTNWASADAIAGSASATFGDGKLTNMQYSNVESMLDANFTIAANVITPNNFVTNGLLTTTAQNGRDAINELEARFDNVYTKAEVDADQDIQDAQIADVDDRVDVIEDAFNTVIENNLTPVYGGTIKETPIPGDLAANTWKLINFSPTFWQEDTDTAGNIRPIDAYTYALLPEEPYVVSDKTKRLEVNAYIRTNSVIPAGTTMTFEIMSFSSYTDAEPENNPTSIKDYIYTFMEEVPAETLYNFQFTVKNINWASSKGRVIKPKYKFSIPLEYFTGLNDNSTLKWYQVDIAIPSVADYYNKTEVDSKLAEKVNKIDNFVFTSGNAGSTKIETSNDGNLQKITIKNNIDIAGVPKGGGVELRYDETANTVKLMGYVEGDTVYDATNAISFIRKYELDQLDAKKLTINEAEFGLTIDEIYTAHADYFKADPTDANTLYLKTDAPFLFYVHSTRDGFLFGNMSLITYSLTDTAANARRVYLVQRNYYPYPS